jgi:hypothetical protein
MDKTRVENIDCMIRMREFPDKYFDLAIVRRWSRIPDFRHYLISDDGLVWNTRTKQLKKSCPDHKGYLRVRLIDGREVSSTKKVHRLVAQAFVDGYTEDLQVNHKNCIKSDNRYQNLEMATQSQNTQHAWDNGRMKLTARNDKGVFVRL